MRLQTIKECDLVNVVIEVYRGEKVNIDAVTDDIKWLIGQAEKVARYEKALKEIASREGDYYEDELACIAKEALGI